MKYSLVSPKALETNFYRAKLYKNKSENDFSGWIILALNEDENYLDENGEHILIQVENHLIEEYLSDFDTIQNAPIASIYAHNAGFNKLIKIERDNPNIGYATNQCNLKVDFKQILRYDTELRKLYIKILFNVLFIPIIFPISLGFSIYWIYKNRKEIKEYKGWLSRYYKNGNVLPGIVVNVKPTRIATMTNLSKHFGRYPIIKVKSYRFKKLNGRKLAIGDKIPMNATYFDGVNPKHWSDIWPFPIECATSDKNLIGKKRYSIPIEDWNDLEDNLHQINPDEDNIYKIRLEGSEWFK